MGEYPISPIPTVYKGTSFSSRLEARWAVFFDLIGISWQYEPDTYDVGKTAYRPDFWLSNMPVFAEVKPTWPHFSGDPLEKCFQLSRATQEAVVLLDGPPDFKGYRIMTPNGLYNKCDAIITKRKLHGTAERCILELQNDIQYCKAVEGSKSERFNES